MKKIDAKTVDEKNRKKLFIIIIILIFLLIVSGILLHVLNSIKQKNNKDYDMLETVEEVLNYYDCKYISEKESDLDNYKTDIRLVFKYDLYDGDSSNEEFFSKVIKDVAKVLHYKNFRMIDDEKDIEIKVICYNYSVSEIIINDIEDYFNYMDSQKSLSKYVELKTTDFNIQSKVILDLIENNWSNKVNVGTRESIFESYYEYFDEGISTRSIDGKIYNIVFNKRYNENVINDIFPGVELSNIKSKLGAPTFEDEENNVIGYKGKEIYVFFTDNEISIYRVTKDDLDDFFKLVDKFLNDELNLLGFMNQLTYLWPDYSDYEYDENFAFLSYPLKGIDVKIGYDNTNAIVLYNNINATQPRIQRYLQNVEFLAKLQLDNVFEAEKRRVQKKSDLLKECNEYYSSLDENTKKRTGESLRFGIYAKKDTNGNIYKMNFVSKNGDDPNRELADTISSYIWIDSENFVYSQVQTGIYIYNVSNGNKQKILSGNESYNLNSFENGVLKYDNSELIIQ